MCIRDRFRPAGPDQIISTIGNTTVWKRQRIGVWQGRLTLTGVRGTDGLGERMFLQLQSEDKAAVSVGLAHIGNEVSQGVDYDVPVSYTHLDVYKRQHAHSASAVKKNRCAHCPLKVSVNAFKLSTVME